MITMAERERKFRPHGGAKRGVVTYKTLRELGYTQAQAYEKGRIEPREEYLARAQERKRAAVSLRREGMTIREIAEEVGVSVGSVHRYIKQAREEGTL